MIETAFWKSLGGMDEGQSTGLRRWFVTYGHGGLVCRLLETCFEQVHNREQRAARPDELEIVAQLRGYSGMPHLPDWAFGLRTAGHPHLPYSSRIMDCLVKLDAQSAADRDEVVMVEAPAPGAGAAAAAAAAVPAVL